MARHDQETAQIVEHDGENLDIDFSETKLFSKEHILKCRDKFRDADLDAFKAMMVRAKKLEADPLTDVWRSEDGAFLLHTHALFSYAARSGRYAPSSKPSEMEQHERLKSDTNPEGFGRFIVWVKVKTDDDVWHDVPGEAYWGDLVPLQNARFDDKTGRRIGGKLSPDSFWAMMPFTMLRKNAFADALRRAFPELSAFRDADQQPRVTVEQRPTQALGEVANRVIEGPRVSTFEVVWNDGAPEMVPETEYAERVLGMLHNEEPSDVIRWFQTNERTFNTFYERDRYLSHHRDAIKLKRLREQAEEAAGDQMMPKATLSNPRGHRRAVRV